MQKLKSALRRRRESGSTDLSEGTHHYGETGSPRRPRRMSVHSKPAPQAAGRSRPLSSADDSRRLGNPLAAAAPGASHAPRLQPTGLNHAEASSQEAIPGPMAKDYNTYIAALSPKSGNESEYQTTRGNDRRAVSGQNQRQHEDDLADRNTYRQRASMDAATRKPLPALPLNTSNLILDSVTSKPAPLQTLPNKGKTVGSAVSAAPSSTPAGDYVVSRDVATNGGRVDGILLRTDGLDHDKSHYRRSDWPLQPSHDEGADFQPAIVDGHHESEEQRQLRLKGVVDLRNTIDTDADVHWTPAVTHELIKPHKHEVIQHKIYREIHNYEMYHRIQPVIHTEVLPPRHWIPNPNGEGLIEISAEELPARTGDNRWWSIVQHEPAPITYEREWRTQPQIIKGKSTMTAEGFKRKETTILHPPTLASLSGYDGLVQPVHFDHKTGERWWGEITTMDMVEEQSSRPPHSETPLDVDGLAQALPKVPSSPSQKRKPIPANSASGVY
ncbi:hypothetical protein P153DRAFT_286325 [Dothidotthia symphoricarpi CBS 119687]|uniref:Uncharacterized protein n=1 Tax=Dothidotthia symphoricarpi CBS 119687 TaxID=1392245 RepID=A0A6A6AMF7_9PLEO|nr:uncharacterized protein P153DRAFT_286325 [Dothidotthia symphoricarpi CBS 119687]KAF2131661.1 hypothetical protein P153DRAFT_286325 [Dothidotthia symphoricarpi CBS 119687]